jgi:hypothetical protein
MTRTSVPGIGVCGCAAAGHEAANHSSGVRITSLEICFLTTPSSRRLRAVLESRMLPGIGGSPERGVKNYEF